MDFLHIDLELSFDSVSYQLLMRKIQSWSRRPTLKISVRFPNIYVYQGNKNSNALQAISWILESTVLRHFLLVTHDNDFALELSLIWFKFAKGVEAGGKKSEVNLL